MSEPRLTFKEMCAKYDVTPRTLRYYEYIELLHPDREGRARFYGPRECARMTLILRGRKFGYSLEGIRQWLLIYEKEARAHRWKLGSNRRIASCWNWPSSARSLNRPWKSCAACATRRQRPSTRADRVKTRALPLITAAAAENGGSGIPDLGRSIVLAPRATKLRGQSGDVALSYVNPKVT